MGNAGFSMRITKFEQIAASLLLRLIVGDHMKSTCLISKFIQVYSVIILVNLATAQYCIQSVSAMQCQH